ncbi:hypothetical protein [Bradyrhizobium genosp. L]|uniref:hypothetical protein n=1 Tax=Bradyrhizobium genosp. L TaxID=83637 RepID=UPI003D9B16C9
MGRAEASSAGLSGVDLSGVDLRRMGLSRMALGGMNLDGLNRPGRLLALAGWLRRGTRPELEHHVLVIRRDWPLRFHCCQSGRVAHYM